MANWSKLGPSPHVTAATGHATRHTGAMRCATPCTRRGVACGCSLRRQEVSSEGAEYFGLAPAEEAQVAVAADAAVDAAVVAAEAAVALVEVVAVQEAGRRPRS